VVHGPPVHLSDRAGGTALEATNPVLGDLVSLLCSYLFGRIRESLEVDFVAFWRFVASWFFLAF